MKGSLLMTKCFMLFLLVSNAAAYCAKKDEVYMGKKDVVIETCEWGLAGCKMSADGKGKLPLVDGKKNVTLYLQQCDPTKATAGFTKYKSDLNAYAVPVQGEEYKKFPIIKQFTMTMTWSAFGSDWTTENFAGKTYWNPKEMVPYSISKSILQGMSDAFCMLSMQMDPLQARTGSPCPYSDESGHCSASNSPLCPWDILVVTDSDNFKEDESGGRRGGDFDLPFARPTSDPRVRTQRISYGDRSNVNTFDIWGTTSLSKPAMQMLDVEFIKTGKWTEKVKVTFVVFLKNEYQAVAMDHMFEFVGTNTMDTFGEYYVKPYINTQMRWGTTKSGNKRMKSKDVGQPYIKSVDEITALKPRSGSDLCPGEVQVKGKGLKSRKYPSYIEIDQFMITRLPQDGQGKMMPHKRKPMEFCLDSNAIKILYNPKVHALEYKLTPMPRYYEYGFKLHITPQNSSTGGMNTAAFRGESFCTNAAVRNAFVNAMLFTMHEAGKHGGEDGKYGVLGAMTAADVKIRWLTLAPNSKTCQNKQKDKCVVQVNYIVRIKDEQEHLSYQGFLNWAAGVYTLNRRLVKELADISSSLATAWTPYPKPDWDTTFEYGKYENGKDVTWPVWQGKGEKEAVAALGFVDVESGVSGGSGGGGSGSNSTTGSDSKTSSTGGASSRVACTMAVMGVITMFSQPSW